MKYYACVVFSCFIGVNGVNMSSSIFFWSRKIGAFNNDCSRYPLQSMWVTPFRRDPHRFSLLSGLKRTYCLFINDSKKEKL
jgi:hypothetical protein